MRRLLFEEEFLENGVKAYQPNRNSAEETCSVCLDPCVLSPGAALVQVSACGHVFHKDCIMPWFTGGNVARNKCPNCRCFLFLPHVRRATDPRLRFVTPTRTSLRFSVRAEDFLPHDPQGLHRHLEQDLLRLQEFVRLAISLEQDHMDLTRMRWRWQTDVVADILFLYAEEQYPRTNYVTHPTLQWLTVVAALIYELGHNPLHNNTIEFAQLVTHGDNLLLQAQREAGFTNPGPEYIRVLGHPDMWESFHRPLTGNNLRIRWIVELRIRVRGRNANMYGPRQREENL